MGKAGAGGDQVSGDVFQLRVTGAVVELRRPSFLFLDERGRVAQDLLAAYETVTGFSDLPMASGDPSLSARWEVEKGPSRTGTIDFLHAVYEDREVEEIEHFLSEAPPFLKRATKHLGSHPVERLGVLFTFEHSVAVDRRWFAERIHQPLGETEILLETLIVVGSIVDDWVVKTRLNLNQPQSQEQERFAAVVVQIDQARVNVPYRDALAVSLPDAYVRARRIAVDTISRMYGGANSNV